jgi:CheY-like chemotaxis protein
MNRILLADDSSHAQRIGECILREEGYEVVSVTDGDTALLRLADVAPDVILADVLLPGKNGYEICRFVKEHPRLNYTQVVLTAGAQEPFDESEARQVHADGSLRKPFEASVLLETVRPLVDAAEQGREKLRAKGVCVDAAEPELPPATSEAPPAQPDERAGPDANPETVRAAVTVAIGASLPALVDEITRQVLTALKCR